MKRPLPYLLIALALLVAVPALSQKVDRKIARGDLLWTLPGFDSLGIASIAMLPVASYSNDLPAERTIAASWGATFVDAGYRWVSAGATKAMLGDSLARIARNGLLQQGRPDSLMAATLCAKLRVDAVLGVRAERWEKTTLEWNQAGKPTTTIQLRAALVAPDGRLLWSGAGSETGEGPYQEAGTNPLGVNSTGLGTRPVTGAGGPPEYADVLARLLTRWRPAFPAKAAAATSR
jgi:hypothetical protein